MSIDFKSNRKGWDMITYQAIKIDEISALIDFDNLYLRDALAKMGIPMQQLPPSLLVDEVKTALDRNDDIQWIMVDKKLAGYVWFQKKLDCIDISGVALHPDFQGMGLLPQILDAAEQKAHNARLSLCKLAVIPLNGRAIRAYLKHGYKITQCVEGFFGPEHPESFRFIMEKNLSENKNENFSEGYEIICSDYQGLKKATDNSYIGIRIIRSENSANAENKISFAK